MANPYTDLPETAFWRTAVGQKHLSEIGPLWTPKFDLRPAHAFVTFGSCFAQHIGRALQRRNFNWLVTEPPPAILSPDIAQRFNYNVFSCRTGNLYTSSLLLQWVRWALLDEAPPPEVWESGGRFIDPFRPAVEPGGFDSVEELTASRKATISAFATAIRSTDYFVFTLGLTESWWNKKFNYEYPMCPGTTAGEFDADQHEFRNLEFYAILDNLRQAIDLMRKANSRIKLILTVSPVPLTATNSGRHVLVATMESKSLLRAVAGQIVRHHLNVDYFPSYEIISSPVMQGVFFEPNRRTVSPMGVDFVMDRFFASLRASAPAPRPAAPPVAPPTEKTSADLVCEEELLASFAPA